MIERARAAIRVMEITWLDVITQVIYRPYIYFMLCTSFLILISYMATWKWVPTEHPVLDNIVAISAIFVFIIWLLGMMFSTVIVLVTYMVYAFKAGQLLFYRHEFIIELLQLSETREFIESIKDTASCKWYFYACVVLTYMQTLFFSVQYGLIIVTIVATMLLFLVFVSAMLSFIATRKINKSETIAVLTGDL